MTEELSYQEAEVWLAEVKGKKIQWVDNEDVSSPLIPARFEGRRGDRMMFRDETDALWTVYGGWDTCPVSNGHWMLVIKGEEKEESSTVRDGRHKCRCDYWTVIRLVGCKCGGW